MEFDFSKMPGLRQNRSFEKELISPLVSIITPFYNAGLHFEQTFYSVINQTFPWFEWIIVDDGSSKTEDKELLKRLAKQDSRIQVYTKENGGISTARNYAIQKSNTEFIVPLDADDLIEPVYIECLYFALLFNEDYDWSYTNSIGFENLQYVWREYFDCNRLKTYNFLTYSGMIRKSALQEVGMYYEGEKHYYEDWYLWLKLLAKGKKPIRLDFYGFWYRRTDGGVLSKVSNNKSMKERAMNLINTAAKEIKTPIKAKQYPSNENKDKFFTPKEIPLDRKIATKKIGILMIIPWMQLGGADAFNLEFVKGLDKNKYSISIMTTLPDQNIWKQRFQEYVDEIYELPSFLDANNFASFISYYISSRDIKIVFLSQSYYGYYVLPWLRLQFPSLVLIDYMHIEELYWRSGGYARTTGIQGEVLDQTYVCCDWTRNILIQQYGRKEDSVKTVYIGVDDNKFKPNDSIDLSVLNEVISSNRPLILFPCRQAPQKRPFLMLSIAESIAKIQLNIAFAVVGDGPLLQEMKTYTEKNGLDNTVYFFGQQENMLPFYKRASITLICSIKEGLSLTAYESLSMETPVISSDVGGQSELIDDSVGRIIPMIQSEQSELNTRDYSQKEVNMYVDAITGILDDKVRYEAMCKEGRNRIIHQFSIENMVKQLENEMEELLSPHHQEERISKARELSNYKNIVLDYLTLYNELSLREDSFLTGELQQDTKSELLRIMNSKWGRRMIKLAFKLRLNRLF